MTPFPPVLLCPHSRLSRPQSESPKRLSPHRWSSPPGGTTQFPKVERREVGKLSRASSETPTLRSYNCLIHLQYLVTILDWDVEVGIKLQVTCAMFEVLKIRYRNVTPCPDYCFLDIYSANTCRSINAAFVPNGSQEENVQQFSSLNNSRQKIVQVGEAFFKSLIIHLGSQEILPGSRAHPPQTITFTFSMAI